MPNSLSTTDLDQPIPIVMVLCNSPDTGAAWAFCLQQKNIQVILETSPVNILQRITDLTPDLLVIDLSRLTTNVLNSTRILIKDLRNQIASPILMLSSRQEEDHVIGLYEAGVDEVIIKPISPAMFVAKTRAWLRRSWTVPVAMLNKIRIKDINLLPEERVVVMEGRGSTRLTNLELRLLHVLMAGCGKAIGAEELLNRTWGYSGEADNTLLKNMIYRLRRKVESDPAQPQHILTVAGIGYKFVAD